ncbi:hypothetical protein PHET_02526 [Paragonimus heterotremus]|uniref:G-protein coupled receptors family 2 profile 2 domain-containing protein n=1 Tax=Paragonimus heterotremus TaxID=100268 RepID=A0A8J4WTQ3_9TREM|nr:hypothetical protein PHET_02526 [Paragonimus heterotremus]
MIWIILRSTVTTGTTCWIVDSSPNSPSRLLVVLFPVIMILLNIAFFINILRIIWGKLNSQLSNEASRLRQSTSVLVLIFGIYHVIFVPLDLMDSNNSQQETAHLELIKLYYRQVLEALQVSYR